MANRATVFEHTWSICFSIPEAVETETVQAIIPLQEQNLIQLRRTVGKIILGYTLETDHTKAIIARAGFKKSSPRES